MTRASGLFSLASKAFVLPKAQTQYLRAPPPRPRTRKEMKNVGRKGVKKQFWLTKEEAAGLEKNAKATGLTQVSLIRMLLAGYRPPEAPGREFYQDMNKLIDESAFLERLSRRAPDQVTRSVLADESMKIRALRLGLIKKYLSPDGGDK